MTTWVHEIQMKSKGFPGEPGYTNLYFELASVDASTDAQFLSARKYLGDVCSALMPTSWSGQINAVGRVLLADSGNLVRFSTCTTPEAALFNGFAGAGFGSGVSGAVQGWSTASVKKGRVVRGRTFFVPLSIEAYELDGTLNDAKLLTCETAAAHLISDAVGFCIYSRPVGGAGGSTAPVIAHRMQDRAAFLSSRRA